MAYSCLYQNYLRDVERYAQAESHRIRGCQKRMDEIEKLVKLSENGKKELKDYAARCLEYLVDDMDYDERFGKLSEKAKKRWNKIKEYNLQYIIHQLTI